jgi:hypothetical protein
MRRTGSGCAVLALLALLAAAPAGAEINFYQEADREEVGTEDTFRLTVIAVDAPNSAQVELPSSDDFEVLSTSRSTESSFVFSSGGSPVMQTTRRYTLLLRANRTGRLTLPPAEMTVQGRTLRTQPVVLTVRSGRLGPPPGQAGGFPGGFPDPFRRPPFGGFPDPSDPLDEPEAVQQQQEEEQVDVPRGDADLFLRASLDRREVYVGEQLTLALYIYSRVDLSSVDAVTMPKLEGFWSEEVDSPTQLTGEDRLVNGMRYRVYLLRRRAIFPMKSGTLTISPAEADITTGFLFAGHRVHRVANPLEVEVKPLPPGAPPGMAPSNVGSWRLSRDVAQTRVELGQPVTVRVVLEGQGNVKNVTPPRLQAPPALKVYDPTTADKVAPVRGRIQGQRVQEYLVMPQRTGTFTLPAMEFPYFDPATRRYEVARTDPVELVVEPGAGGVAALPGSSSTALRDAEAEQKNVLSAGGLRPLRHQARFEAPATPVWQRPFFVPAVVAPVGLLLVLGVAGLVRGQLSAEGEAGRHKRQAREARKRLAAAEKLHTAGSKAEAFYAEVERALQSFLEARLRAPVSGLTRQVLEARLEEAGVGAELRQQVRYVLDSCEAGRYAPGAEDPRVREQVLGAAAAVMEGWET